MKSRPFSEPESNQRVEVRRVLAAPPADPRAAVRVRSSARGFTLIELLVVVAIIAVLSAVVIPQYVAYRQRGFDARAESDLRNAAVAEEAYFTTSGTYLSCVNAACVTLLPPFRLSATVSISLTGNNGAHPTFSGTAMSSSGSKTFTWDSAAGGMVN